MEKRENFPILIPTLILLCSIFTIIQPTSSQPATSGFKCTRNATCNSLIDYKLPNTTTLSSVRALFEIKNLRTLLAANNLPLTTPQNQTYAASSTLKIPFPCSCNNGRGISNRRPIYAVVPDDGLFHIAAEVFSNLVTYQQIQAINNISDANQILVGQKLWVPLPCSCDDVSGEKVVHYGYSVPTGSTVAGIANQFNTTENVLLELNEDAKDLKADSILDVPLKACTTSVRNDSIDYPLLVPNGTYTLTANNCVRCQCNGASSWVLQCEPSGISSPNGRTCPSTQCAGTAFDLGNITSVSDCNLSRCAYAGYNRNGTILTTCPGKNKSRAQQQQTQSLWGKNKSRTRIVITVIVILIVSAMIIITSICIFIRMRKKRQQTPQAVNTENSSGSTGIIAGGVARAALLFAGPAIALVWYGHRKPQNHFFDVPGEEDPTIHLGQLKRFSLLELLVATDHFSKQNILGRGGFGNVYKGRLANGGLVAVKRLKQERSQGAGELQFQTEVELISMAVHRNLLKLQGFCMTPTERLLVYPYMANGSVTSCLRDRPNTKTVLDWPRRERIALGSARGLAYLHDHCDPKIIHRDVKAANILLDEEFEAVVGDFGLARLMDYKDTHVTTGVCGTIGHIPPEYLFSGRSSEKTDVFGYGMMLLELITGQRAYELARLEKDDDVMLLDWVKGLLADKKLEILVDADLEGDYINDKVEKLIQVALLCTLATPSDRPKMSEVVRMLEGEGLAKGWEKWQNKDISRKEFSNTHTPYTSYEYYIDPNSFNPSNDRLSGPR